MVKGHSIRKKITAHPAFVMFSDCARLEHGLTILTLLTAIPVPGGPVIQPSVMTVI